jgi:LysM repeat protein
MRRFLAGSFAILTLAGTTSAIGEVDVESFRQVQSEVNALTERSDSIVAEVRRLRTELSAVRNENSELKQRIESSLSREFATKEELRKVADQLQKVENQRVADARLVQQKLEELARQVSKPIILPPSDPVPAPTKKPRVTKTEESSTPEATPTGGSKKPADDVELPSEYVEHVVKKGQTLSLIIEAYNKESSLKIRMAHVLKANPGLNPKKLLEGQKIKIPLVK